MPSYVVFTVALACFLLEEGGGSPAEYVVLASITVALTWLAVLALNKAP
ncbi:MAG TPA: hypothetical protein VEC01_09215 [Noviherbaspirillum sp.]|nr:hypothetical protein [Noviherbaspirillum sp.]HYD95493.1 hypothetical protein [Noviherbaspirillum sp.]